MSDTNLFFSRIRKIKLDSCLIYGTVLSQNYAKALWQILTITPITTLIMTTSNMNLSDPCSRDSENDNDHEGEMIHS